MDIHQLQIKFVAEEDRLLLSISTTTKSEFCLLLTRRFVKLMMPVLVQVMTQEAQVNSHTDEDVKKAALSMVHEANIAQADFSHQYQQEIKERPLGDAPVVVVQMQVKNNKLGTPILCFYGGNKKGIEMSFDYKMLHTLYKMIADCAKTADWDLTFTIGQAGDGNLKNRLLN